MPVPGPAELISKLLSGALPLPAAAFLEWLLPLLVQVLVAGPSIILPFSLHRT